QLGGGEVKSERILSVAKQVIPCKSRSTHMETVIALPGERLHPHHAAHDERELLNNVRANHRVSVGSDPQHVGVSSEPRRTAVEDDRARSNRGLRCRRERLARRTSWQLRSIVEVLRRVLPRAIRETM